MGKGKSDKKISSQVTVPPEKELSRQEMAEKAKASGNAALADKKFDEAISFYTTAIDLYPNYVYFSNRSAAYYEKGLFNEALSDGERCVELNPEWGKGYGRIGAAMMGNGLFAEAIKAYARGLAIDPTNAALKEGMTQAQAKYGTANKKEPVIGIDLGTTYSCVGVWENDQVTIIPDEEGRKTVPSIVAFTAAERLVGNLARHQASSNQANTVYDVKRIIGQRITDAKVEKDIKRFPFKVIAGDNEAPLVQVKEQGVLKTFTPQEISSMVLMKMKSIAENYLKQKVTKAVITVPAYFNDAQRQATKDAGKIAGLEVLRIINEPTAAALAYGLDLKSKSAASALEFDGANGEAADEESKKEDADEEKAKTRNILIFDLGGGTFDVSILRIEKEIFEVLATGGDTHLGGEDFDDATQDHLLHLAAVQTASKGGVTAGKGEVKAARDAIMLVPKKMHRLRIAAEEAKRNLSVNESTKILLDSFIGDGVDFQTTLTRAQFEELNQEPFQRCMDTVKAVMKDAKVDAKNVSDIVLVGGSTRIPLIQNMLSKHFGGKELCRSINPDEAVAYGAAVQGAILGGVRHASTQDLLLVDVTPISLGIELSGRLFSTIIPRNTPVPCSRTKTYTTCEDYQTIIDVVVYEGERSSVDSCNKLGDFKIAGIERAKRGEPQIQVCFTISAEGLLKVTAKDTVTGASAETSIAPNAGRLSQKEIDQMISDSMRYAEEDKKRVERIETLNEFDALVSEIASSTGDGNKNLEAQTILQEARIWMEENGAEASKEQILKQRAEFLNKFKIKGR